MEAAAGSIHKAAASTRRASWGSEPPAGGLVIIIRQSLTETDRMIQPQE